MDGGGERASKVLTAMGCNLATGGKWAIFVCLLKLILHYVFAVVGWGLLLLLTLFVALTLEALN